METFGEAVHRWLSERDMSLRELARRARVDAGHLSRVAGGHRPAGKTLAVALDRALDAGGQLLAIVCPPTSARRLPVGGWGRPDADALAADLVAQPPSAESALRLAHEWMVTEPPQLYEMRAGRRIGADTVHRVSQRVHQLRQLDDHVGGRDTHEMVTAELCATLTLLREAAYTEVLGRRLLGLVGELCQLAGWVTSDAGMHAEAARLYLTGVRAAHAAGDAPGAASNLSSLAYQVSNVGDPRQAVLMAGSAVRGAESSATATTCALLLDRYAWTAARAGDPGTADRALGRVDEAYADRQPADDPAWVYWLDGDEISIMAGRCWVELRRPLRAVPVLEVATQGYSVDTARESALYLSWLAEAYVQGHEPEQAAAVATRTLTLARSARSTRTDERMVRLHGLLAPFHGTSLVDAFEEAYQS